MRTGREIRLAGRPQGWPTAETFAVATVDVPDPTPGSVLVRNVVMSVDPYMRSRMNDVKSYAPPFEVGAVLQGGAVGEVIAENGTGFAPGDMVLHNLGWRDYAVGDARLFQKVDTDLAPASAYLGVLGMPGLTAYIGLLDIAAMRPGDTVFVSGAAGAVGGLVGQIARLRGAARVVGSAGSAAKVAHLTERLGFDAAFNYRDGSVRHQLRSAAPDGIDVYFDNVGGEHLDAALVTARVGARIAVCGAISQYNDVAASPGPDNLGPLVISKRLMLRGFIVTDHPERVPDFRAEVGQWLADGKIHAEETVVDGLESAPNAFLGLLRGENTGKMIVRI